jgi:regulator of sigma E protease
MHLAVTLLQDALAFLVVLGSLVVVHEMGHYWVARWCGVKVLRFSVGMGKIIFSRKVGPDQTEWAISILPLGGYVKMLDAREQDVTQLTEQELRREFTRQSVWRRIAIVAAGPLANFALAILVLSGLNMAGAPEPSTRIRSVPPQSAAYQAGLRGGEWVTAVNGKPVRGWLEMRWELMQAALEKSPARLDLQRPSLTAPASGMWLDTVTLPLASLSPQDLEGNFLAKLGIDYARPQAVLGKVDLDGPAEQAGLKEGDVIVAVNDQPVADALAFVDLVHASGGRTLTVKVRRGAGGEQEFVAQVTPRSEQVNGQTIGRIKVAIPSQPEMVLVRSGPWAATLKAARQTWSTSAVTLKMFGKMLIGQASWKNVTGPISIADYAGQTARIGLVSYLNFIAFISISLGVMNLLPIPVLDGGLLLYYSLEVLMGRPLPARFNEIAQRVGLSLLMMLMVVAIFNDIGRHIP